MSQLPKLMLLFMVFEGMLSHATTLFLWFKGIRTVTINQLIDFLHRFEKISD